MKKRFKREKPAENSSWSLRGGLPLGRLRRKSRASSQPTSLSMNGPNLSGDSINLSAIDPGPNTPAALQEIYEAAQQLRGEHHPDAPFTAQGLKSIFSGAPHFLLERGRNLLWYPHILFPWDDNASIQNLRDRKPLNHPSHTLSTLHAHLPVCVYPEDPQDTNLWPRKVVKKRTTFDLGVFEVPNMLSSRAKEAGCIGFRNYLELPVSHASRYIANAHSGPGHKSIFPGTLPGHPDEPYSYCRPRIMIDRTDFLREGPTAWRRLGLRYVSVKRITERLDRIGAIREDVLGGPQRLTILDKESVSQLNEELFSDFLFPLPKNLRDYVPAEPDSLQYQIVVLMQVLGVKGPWIDFSLVEWRIRAGQIMWEASPHQDGDCIDFTSDENEGLERKWLILQILLTGELVLRVDAAVKLGIVGRASDFRVTPHDIYQMNEMRTHQLDWGIITGRRAVENLAPVYYSGQITKEQSWEPKRKPSKTFKTSRIKEKFSRTKLRESEPEVDDSAWHCRILPRHPMRQLEGLFVFVETLGWPGARNLRASLTAKFNAAIADRQSMIAAFDSRLRTKPIGNNHRILDRQEMYRKSQTARLIHLQVPPDEKDKDALYLGGWVSRSWFSGFVLPGESTNDLLISTLLENDPLALKTLGPIANLYGGFIYEARSYWSKTCILGRIISVFSPYTICMGWASSDILPEGEHGEMIPEAWYEINVRDNHTPIGETRIFQGNRVLLDSSPLGAEGDLTPRAFSLPMDKPNAECYMTTVQFSRLTFSVHPAEDDSKPEVPQKVSAAICFQVSQKSSSKTEEVSLPLTFNVQFISSYTCLPPAGYISHLCSHSSGIESPPQFRHHTHPAVPNDDNAFGDIGETEMFSRKLGPNCPPRLPGHPLHTNSYPFSYIPVSALHKMIALQRVQPRSSFMVFPEDFLCFVDETRRYHRPHRRETYIIDARGSIEKEAYVRAWCSTVGTNAVVARVGRTCLACSIREARAASVPIVIRVGGMFPEGERKDSKLDP